MASTNGKNMIRIRLKAYDHQHIDKAAEILLMAMQGLDVHYIRNSFEDIGVSRLKLRTYLQDFIMNGIKDHHEGTPLNNDNRI